MEFFSNLKTWLIIALLEDIFIECIIKHPEGEEDRKPAISGDARARLLQYSMGKKVLQSDIDIRKLMFETTFILSDFDRRPFDE